MAWRPNHAGIMANLSKSLWASDLLSVGIHYFAGVVDDAEYGAPNATKIRLSITDCRSSIRLAMFDSIVDYRLSIFDSIGDL